VGVKAENVSLRGVLMKKIASLALASCFLFIQPTMAQTSDAEAEMIRGLAALDWVQGPASRPVGKTASIFVPEGYLYLNDVDTAKFLELNGNPPSGNSYTLLPADYSWWSNFEFSEDGYVNDKEKINADELLQTLKSGDAPSNELRKKLGMESVYTVGWAVVPHYDSSTNTLEWGTILRSGSGEENVNYTVRLLGRKGVTAAILVTSIETLEMDVASFKNTLVGFSYNKGEKYADYRDGDKLAGYGLAALVAGGTVAAVASKGGGKLIFGAIAAAFLAIWGFIKRLFRRKESA